MIGSKIWQNGFDIILYFEHILLEKTILNDVKIVITKRYGFDGVGMCTIGHGGQTFRISDGVVSGGKRGVNPSF